jgi:hypothetical protein
MTDLDLSPAARYRTVWPALITRIAWMFSVRTALPAFGRSRRLRASTATLLAMIPVILIDI